MQPCLPAQPHWLVAVTSIQATSWLAVVVRHILCGLFFFPPLLVMLPSQIPNFPQTHLWEGFLLSGNISFTTPSPGWVSVPNSFIFLSFIFCPTSFRREWAAFLGAWYPLPMFRSCFVEVAQHSNDLWWICGGESGLPILFLRHLGTTPLFIDFLKLKV